jgi:UDP-2,3-diacylglucosamine hydrolase
MYQPPEHMELPGNWKRIDFISDVHLREADTATFAHWAHYMRKTTADVVLILGDLFEAWVGDDVLTDGQPGLFEQGRPINFEQECAQVLRDCSELRPTYLLLGNRDFLLGPDFFLNTGVYPLADPCVLTANGKRFAISHGDALCTDDLPYMRWRAMVRQPQWQNEIQAQPLEVRRAFAKHLREEKPTSGEPLITDINLQEAANLLGRLKAVCLVHGHTHQPGRSQLPGKLFREVLSDWDCQVHPPRAQVLRFEGGHWHRLSVDQALTR